MHGDLAQISKAKGIYRTIALWTILSPKLGANENSRHLSQEEVNKLGEQAFTVATDKKGAYLSSSK